MVARKKGKVSYAEPRRKTPLPAPVNGETASPSSGGMKRLIPKGFYSEWAKAANAILYTTYDWNPDDLLIAKGKGAKLYQEMVRDPYVKAGLSIKKMSVMRLPTSILPASSSPEDQRVARFCEQAIEDMDTPWHDFLWGILDSVNIGYSVGEMNFRIVEKGEWKGKIALKSVKGKDPYVYTFKINDFGDVEGVVQRIGAYPIANRPDSNLFDPSKFLIASFQPLYNNPYGSSDLRAAYRAFFIKDWSWKFRSIFLEKWGMPTVLGTFPNGTPSSRRQDLEDALAAIQTETVVTIPDDMKVELLKVANSGNITEYERAIADLNKEILVGLIGSFLAVEEGRKTGARAQGQVHFDVNKLFIEALVSMAEEVINRQLIRRIVDLNFVVEKYPKIKFQLSRVSELLGEAELDNSLRAMGVEMPAAYFYSKYGRPAPEGVSERRIGPDPEGATMKAVRIPGFEGLRKRSIPEDKEKIGPLKEMYEYIVRHWDSVHGITQFSERSKIAFDLAGKEREYARTKGAWMSAEDAEKQLVLKLLGS